MAEDKAVETAAKGGKNLFTTKLGPLPVWTWAITAVAIFWYLQRGKGTAAGSAGQQTDPAGNTGTINPATGYVYGTPEDQAAAGSAAGELGQGSSNQSGSTVAGQYADNTSWASAAINYLVGIGVDATVANTAIQQFLSSQTLTTEQQADVNLAIQRLGAPPDPPSPGNAPPPVVTPPSPGTTTATNPPTGLTTTSVSSSSVGLKWNSTTNAKAYTVSHGTTSAASDGHVTVSAPATTTTVSGLKPNTHYYFRVQATPAKAGAGFASTSKTTSKAPATGGGSSGGQGYTEVTVVKWTTKPGVPWNSTLSGIADHYKVKGGYQALAKLNHISNPNLVYPGQKIKVPVS